LSIKSTCPESGDQKGWVQQPPEVRRRSAGVGVAVGVCVAVAVGVAVSVGVCVGSGDGVALAVQVGVGGVGVTSIIGDVGDAWTAGISVPVGCTS
jgi:hypothetical protein